MRGPTGWNAQSALRESAKWLASAQFDPLEKPEEQHPSDQGQLSANWVPLQLNQKDAQDYWSKCAFLPEPASDIANARASAEWLLD